MVIIQIADTASIQIIPAIARSYITDQTSHLINNGHILFHMKYLCYRRTIQAI